MHELGGLLCKTGTLWKIAKIADLEKKPYRSKLVGPTVEGWCSRWGLARLVEEAGRALLGLGI